MTWQERIIDLREELRVRWLLLDAQKRQVLLLLGLYLGYTLLDVLGTIVKARALREAK